MSMNYNDVWEFGAVSDCCGAGVYLDGICAECNDHCTPVEENDEEEKMELTRKNLNMVFDYINEQLSDVDGRGEFDNESGLLNAVERTVEMFNENMEEK